MTDNLAAKPKPIKNKKYMMVRYGKMKTVGWFEHREVNIPKLPCRVVIKTERGLELGDIVGQLCPYKAGQFKMTQQQVEQYYQDSGIEYDKAIVGNVVRMATADDISEEKHLEKIAAEEMANCRKAAKEMNLPMKIVDVEHVFGGERIIFYFMSEGRVDFRNLVKKIAHEYQTRIEMRQIGSRDEAKLLGDYETCGHQCCCIKFLKALKPVNMRMAKMQKATLDPSKISGFCGRLKCCLRYEDQNYNELKAKLPKKNALVKSANGQGYVIDSQILTQLVTVNYGDGKIEAVPLEELEILGGFAKPQPRENGRDNNGKDSNGRDNSRFQKNNQTERSPAKASNENEDTEDDQLNDQEKEWQADEIPDNDQNDQSMDQTEDNDQQTDR
jgi:cell fate regulator YaaT (PSP1 superfamily)